jgi:hypothetical protein
MSRVEEIERAIQELDAGGFAQVVQRVHELEQERWDAEMDRDAASGRLDSDQDRLLTRAVQAVCINRTATVSGAGAPSETCDQLRAAKNGRPTSYSNRSASIGSRLAAFFAG